MSTEEVTNNKPAPPGLFKSFIGGGVGGMALVFVGHPLDTIKVRLQTQPVPKAGELPLYSGTWDCASKTLKREGVKGFYRGMAAPLAGVTPIDALCFLGYGFGQKIFTNKEDYDAFSVGGTLRIAAAGATSALFTTPILAPGERIKVTLQIQGAQAEAKFKGPMDVWKHLYRTGGLKSANRGFMATLGRDGVASAFYFPTYVLLKRALTPVGAAEPGTLGVLFAGGCAGILNWAACLPIDTLKSRLQAAPDNQYKHGIRSVFRDVMKTEGIGALWKGWQAVFLRAFPANAACFLGVETAYKLLNMIPFLDGY